MAHRPLPEGIHGVYNEPSDKRGHEDYIVVIRSNAEGNSCSCLDWYKHTHLYDEKNYVCKHIARRAERIISETQAKAAGLPPVTAPEAVARSEAPREEKKISFS
jgi:hypothetical protein